MIRIVAILVALYAAWRAFLVLRMWLYVRRSQSRSLSGYAPRAAVIVPCWEAHPHLETRMRALLEQDYPDHRVIFATGSSEDPAWPILNRLAGQPCGIDTIPGGLRRGIFIPQGQHPKATLVTSGRPTTCSQKVHNSLRALQEVGDAEVYVFADSDAEYPPTWLKCLVSRLDEPEVSATTGCFWWEPSGGGLWTRVLAWGFNTQIVPFFAGDTLTFAWGGSMAIKATTFREAGIAEIWQNVAYDDLTLAAALSRRRLKMPFVPEALVNVPVSDGRPSWCLNWLKREMVAGKVYNPRMYRLALLLTVPLALMVLSPLILLASLSMPGLRPMGFLLLSILPIRMITGALFCLAVGRPKTALYASLDYLGVILGLVGTYLSIFTRRFTWGDLTYVLVSPQETRLVGAPGGVLSGSKRGDTSV
jgi:cellulose synthase/poly-beta-1,6-N-acetylglucosamine synthase-like glycosyltransferase